MIASYSAARLFVEVTLKNDPASNQAKRAEFA